LGGHSGHYHNSCSRACAATHAGYVAAWHPLDGCNCRIQDHNWLVGELYRRRHIAMVTAALAVTGEYDNMCTMGLANGKDVKTDCSVNTQIQGKTYCFGNQSALTQFMADPSGNLAKAQAYYSKKHPG
jgi:YHS domain-containing protein